MLGEAAVHADGVWKLQNDSTKEMTAQVTGTDGVAVVAFGCWECPGVAGADWQGSGDLCVV